MFFYFILNVSERNSRHLEFSFFTNYWGYLPTFLLTLLIVGFLLKIDNIKNTPSSLYFGMLFFSLLYIVNYLLYSIYSSSLGSNLTNTSLGLEPLAGPIIPLSSNKSIIRAALLYPKWCFLWIREALIFPVWMANSTISL